MKCALCNEKKGKRGCKRTGRLVCSPCCASTRSAECGDCSYYEPCLAYQRDKQVKSGKSLAEVIPEVDDRCDEALALVERGNVARALAILEDLRRQYPRYHTVLYGIGVCHAIKGEPDDAISFLEQAVEIFPPFAHAHYNLGSSYCQKVDLEKALKAYEAAIAADGPDGSIAKLARERIDGLEAITRKNGLSLSEYIQNQKVFDRAFAALRERRFQDAIGLFRQVLAAEPGHVQSYGNMGLAYAGLGDKKKALECLDKAIELDPEYEPALMNRLAVKNLEDGEPLPGVGSKEISYYSDFKHHGRSYLQEVLGELGAGSDAGPHPSRGGAQGQ